MPATCIRRRRTSSGYVKVCDIDPARAPQINFDSVETAPSESRKLVRKASYAAKLICLQQNRRVKECEDCFDMARVTVFAKRKNLPLHRAPPPQPSARSPGRDL